MMSDPVYFFKTVPGMFQPFAICLVLGLPLSVLAGIYHLKKQRWGAAIGIVLGTVIVVATFGQTVVKARTNATLHHCKENLVKMADGLHLYKVDSGDIYPETLDQLVPKYLEALPTCPETGKSGYHYQIDSEFFTIYCDSANHRAAGVPEHYPQFRGADGLVER